MREDVAFNAEGVTLRGWLYLPDRASEPVPTIVLAHGFSPGQGDVTRPLRRGVGGQSRSNSGWPAGGLPKTTQSERDTTSHNPALPSRRTSPELDGLLPPARLPSDESMLGLY